VRSDGEGGGDGADSLEGFIAEGNAWQAVSECRGSVHGHSADISRTA
jgi:hypothetical protein